MAKKLVSEYIYEHTNEKSGAVSYQVEIRKTVDGEKISYSESFSTKRWGTAKQALTQAKKARNKKIDEIEAGLHTTNDKALINITTSDLFERLQQLFGWSLDTANCKRTLYNKRICPVFGKRKFKTIRADEIQLNLNNLIDTASDNVITNVLTLWRQLYKAAILLRIISYDLTILIIKPVSNLIPVVTDKEYSDDDFYKVLHILSHPSPNLTQNEIDDHMVYYTALITMYYLGCRTGEVLCLTKECIDFKKHIVHINQSIGSSTTEATIAKRPKRKKSIRYIPLHPYLEEILINWIRNHSTQHYLFLDHSGNLINTKAFSTIISGIARYHKISFTPYRLRHRFSTDLLKANTDPRTVIELMGHSTFRMSVEYARSSYDVKKEAIINRSSPIMLEEVAEKSAEKTQN